MKVLLENFIKIIFLLNIVTKTLTQSCNLDLRNPAWLNDYRLILTQGQNNQYQLFRAKNVQARRQIYLYCNNNTPLVRASCTPARQFNVPMPLAEGCSAVDGITPAHHLRPGVDYCPYDLYEVGFDVQINGRNHFFETYKVCFDRRHMRPLYTINNAYSVGGPRPDFRFADDNIFTPRYFSAFNKGALIKRFRTLLGPNQDSMIPDTVEHIIDRGHLTPSGDFTLVNYKRSTFKMINVIPQFKTINGGNWKKIEEWARHIDRTPAQICTGVFDCRLDGSTDTDLRCVVKLRHDDGSMVAMFLSDGRRIPIPLWIYKTVKSSSGSIVFLTLNNIHHTGPIHLPASVCRRVNCPTDTNINQNNQNFAEGITFCCSYNEFMEANIPRLRDIC